MKTTGYRRLTHAPNLANHLVGDLERAEAGTLGRERSQGLGWDLPRACMLADALARDLCHAPAGVCARDLVHARALAQDLARAYAFSVSLDLGRDLARARTLARDLDHALRGWSDSQDADTRHRAGGPASPAGRLLTALACLLPATDRERYREEYRSELWEIAADGAGRCQQLRYVARQTLRVGHLRCAVLASRRRRALP